MKPEAVARTEDILGSAASTWTFVASRGYALGDRWRVDLADGRSAFAKRAIDDQTAEWLRREHAVYTALDGATFMPRLLGWEDTGVPLLLLENLSAAFWPPPWPPHGVESVLEGLAEVASTPPPAGIRALADDPPASWAAVAADPQPFLGLALRSPAWLDQCSRQASRASWRATRSSTST